MREASVVVGVLLFGLVACASSTASDGRVIEVTRIVERVVTAPSEGEPGSATADSKALEPQQAQIVSCVLDVLEHEFIDRVSVVRFAGARLEIELTSMWGDEDSLLKESWEYMQSIVEGCTMLVGEGRGGFGVDMDSFGIDLAVYAKYGHETPYHFSTEIGTLRAIARHAVTFEEWLEAAYIGTR